MKHQYFSPAKINLYLRVLGKRPDGYHELSSLFQTISLGDTLEFEEWDEDVLICTDPVIPLDSSNLILKAINLFRRHTNINTRFKVHLNKQIPVQAGLGGGSSNAATTLWALNEIMSKPATVSQLQAWSAEIGSDIPFFFSEGTAYCTGRGEIVKNVPPLSLQTCLIVKPSIGLSTPEVYRRLNAEPFTSLAFQLDSKYINDLERPAFEIKPELKTLKNELLQAGFETVLMTGSGSAFFCLGKGALPPQNDLLTYQAQFINRFTTNWYLDH